MPTKAKDAPAAAKPKPADGAKRPSEPTIGEPAVEKDPAGAKSQPSELAIAVDPRLKPGPKQRPSEPIIVAKAGPIDPKLKAGPKQRPSDPIIPVDPKLKVAAPPLDPKLKPPKRPSDPILELEPKPAKPVAKPEPKPRASAVALPKPDAKKPAKGELPAEWRALIGKPLTCTWRRASGHLIDVIDWPAFPDRQRWLDDVFGDCEPARHFTGLIARKGAHVEWTSIAMLPVALLGQNGGEGHLEAILLVDTTTSDSPIYSIEVDGTAIPAKKPQQVAANLAALKIEVVKPEARAKAAKVDFDTARPKIVAGKIDNEAKRILQKLSGDRDSGSGYLQPQLKNPKPPEGRDPRWIEALRDELAKSIVAASESLKPETHWLAGTLASFGAPAIPALVAAFETALKSYPKQSLDYGVQPVLLALDYLKSDAGVAPALVVLAKAKEHEKSYAIPPVLDYLKTRTADPRIAPVLKKFYKKAAPKKPMHYIDDLEALAKQLDI